MEDFTILVVLLLVTSIICALVMRRRWKEAEKSYLDIIKKNYELEKFKDYASEVEELRRSFLESLPCGIVKTATLWADLNKTLDWLGEQAGHKKRNSCHTIRQTKGARELRQYEVENKTLQYELEYLKEKYVLALTLLKDKYGEDCVDAEWTKYLAALKVEREEDERQRETKIFEHTKKIRQLEREEVSLEHRIRMLNKERDQIDNEVTNATIYISERIALAKARLEQENDAPLVLEKIASAWVDYKMLIWEKGIDELLRKSRPISFATAIEYKRQIADFKEKILVDYKNLEYQYNYLISLFPELQEYIDGTAVKESNIEEDVEYEDRRKAYVPLEEWEQLSDTEKSQLALDRYNERRRLTNAQVGRDYEEYIAFLFRNRCKGAEIYMYGEQKGLADLGRDLIVKHSGKVYIVQCKRWSQDRVIREKHIMQLFGTTIEYCWEMKKKDIHPLDVIGKSVIPVFVTTTELSPTANRFAERLGVVVHKVPMGDYPQIKCNIGKEGERIYHLPFDQQYNSTLIEHQKGEFMAWTVEEAENNGFRRALRHYIS